MTRKTIAQLLAEERPLVLPVAHDAVSARLIERAGFRAYSVGGFALVGFRYGLPDVGLASFGEISAGVRDLMAGSSLPLLVDGDDGYGDVKNVARTVRTYEAMGAAGLVLEDQVNPKRCGHMQGKRVVPMEVAVRKLRTAVAARRSDEFFLVARTDARGVNGLDDALERASRYAETGVDAVFVEAPESLDELARIGASFSVPVLVNAAEGGRTPILSAAEYAALGFSIIVYPATLMLRAIAAMEEGLRQLRAGALRLPNGAPSFGELTDLFGLPEWAALEERFGRG